MLFNLVWHESFMATLENDLRSSLSVILPQHISADKWTSQKHNARRSESISALLTSMSTTTPTANARARPR